MALWKGLLSGLVGATALTLIHETVRRRNPDAPRMDVLGMRALAKTLRAADQTPPPDDQLFDMTLAGDLLSNAAYYSLVGWGAPQHALARGAILGALAGVGAVVLPGPLGLGEAPSNRTRSTQAMTVAWYLAGGLVAAGVYRALSGGEE